MARSAANPGAVGDVAATSCAPSTLSTRWAAGWLLLLLCFLATARIAAPSDVYDNDQPGPMMHILDVAVNGNWLLQSEPTGRLATKPPMYPWLGALVVKATGWTSETALKLPSLMAFGVVTLVVFDLGRRALGVQAGCIAAAFWAANYHAFKLLYTARTDMLLTMCIVVGVWAVQRQRERWATERMSDLRSIVLFWLMLTAGLLTKGPAALLIVIWLAVAMVIDGWAGWMPHRRARLGWQVGVAIVVLLPAVSWLWATLEAYPDWTASIRSEVADRISGSGSGEHRDTAMLAMPAYFVLRFGPWSGLFVIGAIGLLLSRFDRRTDAAVTERLALARWTIVWVALVLIFFMIPQGRRADYLLPSYAGAAVMAAALVDASQRREGLHRALTHILLGATLIGGIAAIVMYTTAPAKNSWALLCGIIGVVSGAVGLLAVHRRRYDRGAVAGAFAMVAILGVYQNAMSSNAKSQAGEHIHTLVREAASLQTQTNAPLAFYDVGYTPVQPLLGRHQPTDERALASVADGGVLIASRRSWGHVTERFGGRATIVLETPKLPESGVSLILARILPATSQ